MPSIETMSSRRRLVILSAAVAAIDWLEKQHSDTAALEAKSNPYHASDGRFARAGGHGGHHAKRGNRSHQNPVKIRSPEHAEELTRQYRERRGHARDIRGERNQLVKEQRSERGSLIRGQKRDAEKLDRSQTREDDKLTTRQAREAARTKDPATTADRHEVERSDLAETHHQERADLHSEHATDRSNLADEHREARQSQREDHLASVTELRANQRADMAATHGEVRGQREFDREQAGDEKGLTGRVLLKDRRNPEEEGDQEREDREGNEAENTFDLPDGDDIARKLRRFFAIQARKVLGTLPTIGEPLPDGMPELDEFDEPMSRAMTPLISAYWSKAGQEIRAKLGLEPSAWPRSWSVSDPKTKAKIQSAAMAFCRATNATTTMRLADALVALKEEMKTGVVDEGEGVRELGKRVNGIFTGLSKSHARMIGSTEASRAVHEAQEASVIDSDVVQGAEWLLSENACWLCHKIKNEVGRVRLGENFAVVGEHADYKNIRVPPGHPRCRCSVLWILSADMGGPEDVKWGSTLVQPTEDEDDD